MDRSHLRTIIWLRWRLSRNQWSRGGSLNAALTMVIFVAGVFVGCLGAVGGVLLGAFSLVKASPLSLLGIWDGIVVAFLFFWMIGLISELQRSETIDISRMLHLPVHLRDIFLVNYVASHVTLSLILFVPAMLGLSLGLALSRGPGMLLLIPLAMGLIFMVTAWTYCLRGWLVTLMSNPRRRRTIIAGITFSFIIVAQLPNLFMQWAGVDRQKGPGIRIGPQAPSSEEAEVASVQRPKPKLPDHVLTAHKVVPFLWVGNGAMSLARGNPLPALLGAAGVVGLGALGLRRAYRSTVRYYTGQAISKEPKSKPKARRTDTSTAVYRNFLARRVPWVSEGASAVALATFRSMARASEVKMMLATNLFMLLIFGGMMVVRRASAASDDFKPFFATASIVVTFLGVGQIMFNLFGFDRSGFRSLVLLPTPRREVLLGKNLALLPLAVVIGTILLAVVSFLMSLPPLVVLASVIQLFCAFVMLSIVGNWISILVPYRIAAGSMKATKTSTTTTFMLLITRLLFPVAMGPIFLAPGLGLLFSKLGWLPAAAANLLFASLFLAILALAYRLTLAPLGRFLQQREQAILQVVTQEIE